jgi:hypothetical protein
MKPMEDNEIIELLNTMKDFVYNISNCSPEIYRYFKDIDKAIQCLSTRKTVDDVREHCRNKQDHYNEIIEHLTCDSYDSTMLSFQDVIDFIDTPKEPEEKKK